MHGQARSSDPTVAGRWSALPAAEPDSTVRAHFQAELLLNRYGVLTKGASDGVPGGFAMLYKVLTAFEDAGRCQRGYFVESLGGAQFAAASTVDRLRTYLDGMDLERRDYHAVVLAATDPANPYGAALPWPADDDVGHRPGRKAGALVVLVDGDLTWFLERGGRSLLSFSQDPAAHAAAAAALVALVNAGRLPSLLVEKLNGVAVLDPQPDGDRAAVHDALTDSGFARTPRGLRLR
jgi:ATP-dependent helicase Lhr and Lhr-like helicase